MKIWKNKFLKQMIIIITLIFVIVNGIAPSEVYANKSNDSIVEDFFEWVGGSGYNLARLTGISFLIPAEDTSGNSVERRNDGTVNK